ncbi:MAG: hypothetical protein WCW68_09295 [Methanothrix sp.]
MSTKGKSRTRPGRRDLLRSQAADARRRQRRAKAGCYDPKRYDKPISEES